MGEENFLGQTVRCTKENFETTSDMEQGRSDGKTERFTKGHGPMENNTGKELSLV